MFQGNQGSVGEKGRDGQKGEQVIQHCPSFLCVRIKVRVRIAVMFGVQIRITV